MDEFVRLRPSQSLIISSTDSEQATNKINSKDVGYQYCKYENSGFAASNNQCRGDRTEARERRRVT